MSMTEKNRQLIILAVMLAIIGLMFCGFNYLGKQRAKAAKIESEKAQQVSVIPPGTEEAWQTFIDHRMAAVLRREGRLVKLDDDNHRNISGTANYVSINAPYQITCNLDMTSIHFGTDGENNQGVNDSAELFDVYMEGTAATPAYTAEKAPPVGVPQESIAAATLRDHVCRYLANKVQSVLSPQ